MKLPTRELTAEQKSEALFVLYVCVQAVRQKVFGFVADGKRPTREDLESIGGLLHAAETKVLEMGGGGYAFSAPVYVDDWPKEVVKAVMGR